MAEKTLVRVDSAGAYSLTNVVAADVAKIDVIDVDMVLEMKDGRHLVLPGAGMAAMMDAPPSVQFKDQAITVDVLLRNIGTSLTVIDSIEPRTSAEERASAKEESKTVTEAELKKAIDKAVKEAVENAVDKAEAEFEKQREQDAQERPPVSSLTVSTESSVEAMVEKAQKIIENLNEHKYDYVPPHEFRPPPTSAPSPAGQPAPISLTPVITLFMGNVVGTVTDTTTMPGATILNGAGGATGSDAAALLGVRNALQFSTNTITGTAGADLIYAQGTQMGNANPAASISNYAKEFLLNVAGYFITLDAIQFSNVPVGMSIEGATNNGGGSWTLPASYVTDEIAFKIIYDSSATGTVDITIDVTGQTTHRQPFHSQQSIRFQYVDVTNADQVTDPALVYENRGRLSEIYILPTQDQPNLINAGTGNDTIYGGNNHDTITGGDGNNVVTARNGDDIVTLGNGNNTVDLGAGNNTLTTGSGNDTISFGDGNNTINAGSGTNSITGGTGVATITTGSGADTITLAGGGGTINASGGANNIQVGNGNYTITTGSGNDTVVAGNGDNSIATGTGTNSITAGTGTNTLDYSGVSTTGVTLSLVSGSASGTGLTDTFTGIRNVIGTGLADTITGSTGANSIVGGAGNDSITGNGGNDSLYGDDGDDTITGGTGNDLIYGGDGNNTISGGASGNDSLYGGSGNDTFLSPHAGNYYNGTNGAALTVGERNHIDYSASTGNMVINLATGVGSGSLAASSTYALTSVAGFSSINGIIAGSGNDSLVGSAADDSLSGGGGSDTLNGGLGNNTLTGGTGGTDIYVMGLGTDTIIGSTSSTDHLYYQNSGAGVVVNLSNATQTYTNSLGATRTVAAYSGSNLGVTAADANSHSNGDYYTPVSGANTSIDIIYGSSYADLIYGGTAGLSYYNYSGGADTVYGGSGNVVFYTRDQAETFVGGSGNDQFFFSGGADRADGGTGFNIIRTTSWHTNAEYNARVYLDGMADTNNNGIADYIDRGVPSLVSGGVTYTGFQFGWGNATTGAGAILLKNFDNIVGSSGNDFFAGNGNDNQINALDGTNSIFGLGGNDIITAIEGTNAIDGGSGTDTVNFQYTANAVSGSLSTYSPNYTSGAQVFLSQGSFLGASDAAIYWGSSSLANVYQARTGDTGLYSYSTIVNVENINGSDYNDVLYGNSSANVIYGNNGNDTLAGGGGADTLYGGAGNDTFRATSAEMPTVALFDGGTTGTDTIFAPGWTFAANSFATGKYASIEVLDVRNSTAGGTYGMAFADVVALADNGTASTVTLNLDAGDTFTASAGTGTALLVSSTATDHVYKFYSDPGHTINNSINLQATLNVHFGP